MSWRDQAACRSESTELFMPQSSDPSRAKALCYSCVVSAECLEFALTTESIGIWAGTEFKERFHLQMSSVEAAPMFPAKNTVFEEIVIVLADQETLKRHLE